MERAYIPLLIRFVRICRTSGPCLFWNGACRPAFHRPGISGWGILRACVAASARPFARPRSGPPLPALKPPPPADDRLRAQMIRRGEPDGKCHQGRFEANSGTDRPATVACRAQTRMKSRQSRGSARARQDRRLRGRVRLDLLHGPGRGARRTGLVRAPYRKSGVVCPLLL